MKRSKWDAGGWSGPGITPSGLLLLLWTSFIIYGTMLPFDFHADFAAAAAKLRGLPSEFIRSSSRIDVMSNVLLFMPFGFLLSLHAEARRAGLVRTVVGAASRGLALSFSIESAQLLLPSRTTSPIDVATNVAGASVGSIVGWVLVRWAWPSWSRRVEAFMSRCPLATCALAAGIGLVMVGLSPFDVSIDLGDLKSSMKRARPIPFGPSLVGLTPPVGPWTEVQDSLSWALAGGLVVLALREAGSKGQKALVGATALCGGLALLIEITQLVIVSRTADATSVVFAVIGSAVGAAIVGSFPRRGPRRWIGPALALWAVMVIVAAWTPPRLKLTLTWLRWTQLVPFWAYYQRTNIYALADLVDEVLTFTVLGALMAARGIRRPIGRSLLLGLAFGMILEAGQLLLSDRTAEITDVLSAGGGAALGAWFWVWGSTTWNPSRTGNVQINRLI